MNDDADTLPLQRDLRSVFDPDARVATEPQKVAHIARHILTMVGCPLPYGHSSRTGELTIASTQEVAQWWAARKDNPDWLNWYEFLYLRASQGTTPVPKTAADRITRFRRQIDVLQAVPRAWILLYLADAVFMSDGEWHNDFASQEEMIDAANLLGPENLIAFFLH